jgi:hypothetical protein
VGNGRIGPRGIRIRGDAISLYGESICCRLIVADSRFNKAVLSIHVPQTGLNVGRNGGFVVGRIVVISKPHATTNTSGQVWSERVLKTNVTVVGIVIARTAHQATTNRFIARVASISKLISENRYRVVRE